MGKHLILISISNTYYSLLRAFSIIFIYFARIITIGYSIKTLMLIGKNPTLISPSNYKHEEEIYHLGPEIIPTFFLSMFVVFFLLRIYFIQVLKKFTYLFLFLN